MDPDPVVIRNLLKNPRLLERDVLRIASAQPVAAEVLSEIFRSDHWCGRPSVQLALLQNPTPPDLARSLLELLDSVGLKSLVDATQIHPALRRAARIRLAEQAGPRTVPGNPYDDAWVAELLESRVEDGQGGQRYLTAFMKVSWGGSLFRLLFFPLVGSSLILRADSQSLAQSSPGELPPLSHQMRRTS